MPKELWAEAGNIAVYILNRSPKKAIRNKTPFEAWNKRKPQVDHMKIFGCIAYALNQSQNKDAKKKDVWIDAMKEEIHVIEKNKTWELVELPNIKEVIGLKYVYKIKYGEDGSVKKHKTRLVANGYSQQPGVDINETFAPLVCMKTIRMTLAVAAQSELNVYQLNIKSVFLNDELQEEVYVEQPQGFVVEGKKNKVYRLRKILYELKQAS